MLLLKSISKKSFNNFNKYLCVLCFYAYQSISLATLLELTEPWLWVCMRSSICVAFWTVAQNNYLSGYILWCCFEIQLTCFGTEFMKL